MSKAITANSEATLINAMSETEKSKFEKAGESAEQLNFFQEFIRFLSENKKWWLMPIFLVLIAFGLLIILGGTGAAPFIYTLF
jgi:hypothetical protein